MATNLCIVELQPSSVSVVAEESQMTKKQVVGYLLMVPLAVLLAAGFLYGTWLPFKAARNSDGAWRFEFIIAGKLSLLLSVVIAALGLLTYACMPSRRSALALKILIATAMLLPIGGCVVGEVCWQREFDCNRRLADDLVQALEHYREEHASYPAHVLDLPRPVTTALHRGDQAHELEYWPMGPGGYTLRYRYGWYEYTYDSGTQSWSRRD